MTETRRPKQAATVILLRRAEPNGFEVFLTRRTDDMPFLGGVYCYPGGTLRKEDSGADIIERCCGLTLKQAQRILGARFTSREAIAHWIAAVREVFEEVGVLFAVEASGAPLHVNSNRVAWLSKKHDALVNRSISFVNLLEDGNLFCDLGRLGNFSYWQTPAQVSVRFDTRFFIAALPEGQTPLATSYEVAHSVWLTPDRAMQMFNRRELPMIFPTFTALRTLADFETLESVLREFQLPRRWRIELAAGVG